jgi:methylene-fatty-acyl-phospholipid synthase
MVDFLTLGVAAALLSVERLTYIAVWSRPTRFQDVCRRLGSPVDVLALLFVVFKLVQGSVFVAWCLVHGGGRLLPEGRSVAILSLSAGLLLAGQTLNLSVFKALGRTGVFYGSRFGYSVPWRFTFPFSWVAHPQYVGALLTIWGFFVLTRYPAPDWPVLPALETLFYASIARVEEDGASVA